MDCNVNVKCALPHGRGALPGSPELLEPFCMSTTHPVSKNTTPASFSSNLGRWARDSEKLPPRDPSRAWLQSLLPPSPDPSTVSIRSYSSTCGLTRTRAGAQVGKLLSHHFLLMAYKHHGLNQIEGFVLKPWILKYVKSQMGEMFTSPAVPVNQMKMKTQHTKIYGLQQKWY